MTSRATRANNTGVLIVVFKRIAQGPLSMCVCLDLDRVAERLIRSEIRNALG